VSADPEDAASAELSSQIRVTLLVGMVAVSLAGLDQTIVSTAQPTIVGELGGIDKVSWIFTAYMLTMAVATPVVAKLSDVYSMLMHNQPLRDRAPDAQLTPQ
jgi:MFS family permease